MFVLVIAFIATLLWNQKDRIAVLQNNGLRMEGDWYRVENDFKGSDVYNFSDRLITRNGQVCGSYELRSNVKLEVFLDDTSKDYLLSFEDDDNMIWSIEVKGKSVRSVRWQR